MYWYLCRSIIEGSETTFNSSSSFCYNPLEVSSIVKHRFCIRTWVFHPCSSHNWERYCPSLSNKDTQWHWRNIRRISNGSVYYSNFWEAVYYFMNLLKWEKKIIEWNQYTKILLDCNRGKKLLAIVKQRYMFIHFAPLIFFYTSWKHQKMRGFPTFSGVIERDQWHEMR